VIKVFFRLFDHFKAGQQNLSNNLVRNFEHSYAPIVAGQ
jgi:hypothetical protein